VLLLYYLPAPPHLLWEEAREPGRGKQDSERRPPPKQAGSRIGWLAAATLLAVYLGGMWTAGISPTYTKDRPKRMKVQHMMRKVYDSSGEIVAEDSGLWVIGMDYIHPLATLELSLAPGTQHAGTQTSMNPDLKPSASKDTNKHSNTPPLVTLEGARVVSHVGGEYPFLDAQEEEIDIGPSLLFNLPWVLPISHMLGKHVMLAAPPVPPLFPLRVTLLEQEVVNSSSTTRISALSPGRMTPRLARRRLRLLVEGADHMVLLFDAGTAGSPSIRRWSLTPEVPEIPKSGTHYILYASGGISHDPQAAQEELSIEEMNLNIGHRRGSLEVEVEMTDDIRPLTFVVISNEKDHITEAASFLTRAFPEWVASCAWTSHWHRYTF